MSQTKNKNGTTDAKKIKHQNAIKKISKNTIIKNLSISYLVILYKSNKLSNIFNYEIYRIEKDTLGNVKVPEGKILGAQTQRSIENFKIGPIGSMPKEIIYAYAIVKMAAAVSNNELKIIDSNKKNLIVKVCKEILEGQHDSQFPLVIWQTGKWYANKYEC